jgi:hypothetical protein
VQFGYAQATFHGRFYGLRNFWCKTVEFIVTPRQSEMVDKTVMIFALIA